MATTTTELVSPDSAFACNTVARSHRWPTEKDWIAHHSTIKKLYLDKGRTLKEVMRIMKKEHGLNAT